VTRRAKLSLSDTERRKGPPPAHGFATPKKEQDEPGSPAEIHRTGTGAAAVSASTHGDADPRPAAGPWQADLGPRTAGESAGTAGPGAAARPMLQRPIVRVALVSAAAALSLWLLKRRLL
jgi:hypothetical protein